MEKLVDMDNHEKFSSMEELLAWFRKRCTEVCFGEVGIVLTKHQGEIIQYKKIENVSGKVTDDGTVDWEQLEERKNE